MLNATEQRGLATVLQCQCLDNSLNRYVRGESDNDAAKAQSQGQQSVHEETGANMPTTRSRMTLP